MTEASTTLSATTYYSPGTTQKQAATTIAPENIPPTTLSNQEELASTQPTDALSTIPQDTQSSRILDAGSEPVADAGGPYSASAGAPVEFDSSKSAAAGRIVNYIWDFGDGSYGKGMKTNHTYKSEGTYRATLSITDESGKASSDSKIVHIYLPEINVEIEILPKDDDGIYGPGESFTRIEVTAVYPNGTPVENATLSGTISGRTIQPLTFYEYGNGVYRMDKEYDILNPVPPFIDIYVNVTDQNGNTGKGLKKLRTVRDDLQSRMMMNDPPPSKVLVAYGEPLTFRLKLFSSKGQVDVGDIYMYEVQTNNRYQFKKAGDEYVLDYRVPWDIGERLNLIFYASYSVNDANYQAVLEKSFDVSPNLKVEVISPVNPAQNPNTTEIKLAIAYPAGEQVTDDQLNATIGDASVPLQKVVEKGSVFYLGNYSLRKGEAKQYIWVTDSSGNGGGTYLQPEQEGNAKAQEIDPRIIPAAAASLSLFTALLILLSMRHKKKQKRMLKVKEYEDQHQKIESLKKLRKNIMHEYYTRQISEEEARKRILDTEKDSVIERGKMKTILQKMGMTPQEIEGKEELIDWVTEKLKTGENIELIKKGLKGLNIDPLLAEKIKKTLT